MPKTATPKALKTDTRNVLLQAGINLLIRKGYSATSINDVVEIAGVPKGSFYYYYKTKEDFVEAAIIEYTVQKRAEMDRHFGNMELSPLNRVRSHFAFGMMRVMAENFESGCLVGHMAQEIASTSPRLRDLMNEMNQAWQGMHQATFEAAIESGELPADTNIPVLIQSLCMLTQGAILESKLTQTTRSFQNAHWLIFEQIGKPAHRLDAETEQFLAIPQ